jgi:hypothetical protein
LKLSEIKKGVWPGETVKLVQVKAEEE